MKRKRFSVEQIVATLFHCLLLPIVIYQSFVCSLSRVRIVSVISGDDLTWHLRSQSNAALDSSLIKFKIFPRRIIIGRTLYT